MEKILFIPYNGINTKENLRWGDKEPLPVWCPEPLRAAGPSAIQV